MGAACSKPSLSMAFNNSGERPNSGNNFDVMQCCRFKHNLLPGERRVVFSAPCRPGPIQQSILSRMLVFALLPLPPRIQHNDDEHHKAEAKKDNDAGLTFPDLLDSTCKLGPIHTMGRYTSRGEK